MNSNFSIYSSLFSLYLYLYSNKNMMNVLKYIVNCIFSVSLSLFSFLNYRKYIDIRENSSLSRHKYSDKFIIKSEKNIKLKYNSLIIDYIIILKQIMKSKNIYFPNNFYKTWVEYLLPVYSFDKNNIYYDYCKLIYFLPKYNINNKIFNIIYKNNNYIYQSYNNIYISVYLINNNIKYENNILYVKININKKYLYILDYTILEYIYEIPMIELYNLKYIKTYYTFNKYIFHIWEKYYGLYMFDYILSKPSNKIIYYEIFKKIIIKFIDQ